MNDGTLTPELARTAAEARVIRAEDSWTKAAVAFLRGHDDAQEQVTAALAELNAARAELRRLDDNA